MSPTQAGQWGAVGTKSGPPWPSKDLWGPQKDPLWPKRALFASFWSFSQTEWFYMGYNSAERAEHSAAMFWTPHKPIFREKNSYTKLARGKGPATLKGLVKLWWICAVRTLLGVQIDSKADHNPHANWDWWKYIFYAKTLPFMAENSHHLTIF